MSNKEQLKQYLIKKENAYLLDNNNNGKTIMLSGEWGSGKTHFWKKEIESDLKEKLKEEDKACVYVSLYGKESLSDIKSDVYLSANGNNLLSKEVATFGMETLSAIKDSDLAIGKAVKAGKALFDGKKMQRGIGKLKKGGVICFDDFERKSTNIDLNDLFGFISQLAINLECKVIIILNSEVFKDKDTEVFNRVKEKTISKFFYFKPSTEELFESISSDPKYERLNAHKEDIVHAIKETEELNARIYTQVLDNCLEWVDIRKELNSKTIRVLVLTTFNFVLNHMILDYQTVNNYNGKYMKLIYNDIVATYPPLVERLLESIAMVTGGYSESEEEYLRIFKSQSNTILINALINEISRLDRDTKQAVYTEPTQISIRKWIDNNNQKLKALCKYGYRLYYVRGVDENSYNEIIEFIESGILI